MQSVKNLIIAQMIHSETKNKIIRKAIDDACRSEYEKGIRFGEVVRGFMPEPDLDEDGFFLDDCPEMNARNELSGILRKINGETANELQVVGTQEQNMVANVLIARDSGRLTKQQARHIIRDLKKAIEHDFLLSAPFRYAITETYPWFQMTLNQDYDLLISANGEILWPPQSD